MTEPYVTDLKDAAKENECFRSVLFTGANSQLVLMSLLPSEEIGMEVHEVDQIFYAVEGEGRLVVDGVEFEFEKGTVACVPAGVSHNVVNTEEDEPLKLFTVYAPPAHAAGTLHRTRAEAEAAEQMVVVPKMHA